MGSMCTAVDSHWLRDAATSPPPPRIWAHIRGAVLVSQDRHLFETFEPDIKYVKIVFGFYRPQIFCSN
jgi:hypothetical protein